MSQKQTPLKPSNAFGVLRHGEPIEIALPYTDIQVETGITLKIQLLGCVPFYEEYAAMVEANYSLNEWEELSPQEKANAVAHYRLKRFIALHEGDALEIRRKSREKR